MTSGIKSLIFSCLPLVFLQACTVSQPTTDTQSAKPTDARMEKPSNNTPSVRPQTFMLRGQLVLSSDIQTITPCNSNQQFIVRFVDPHELSQAKDQIPHPNQPVYAELIGNLEAPDENGPEGDFRARFKVADINILTPDARTGCQQVTHSTRASGHDPDWSVRFQKNRLLYRIGKKTEHSTPLQATRLGTEERRYELNNGKLILEGRLCSPDNSGSLFGWNSLFTLNKQTYHGCASLANLDTTLHWTGLYQASSTQNRDFSVQMQLHADHTATTSYHYQSSGEAGRESGFWQQIDHQRIQVVMTRYQGQKLIAERIFSGDPYQLTATTETVNGIAYPIKDGGLTLFRTQASQKIGRLLPQTRTLEEQTLSSSSEYRPDVAKALQHYFQLHRTPIGDTRYRWLKFDLNRDGKEELLALMNWCGKQGCTMLVFEDEQGKWRFNSRINGVSTPFNLGTRQQAGWQELVFPEHTGQPRALPYTGVSYPTSVENGEAVSSGRVGKITLFRDGLSPQEKGIKL
ncbi:hypothetical protein DI392_18550 [Vibrio albus]|uniref:Lipoprotein n=1 Tax=Vibrio albus TaxID=2200953 RepID=A0A2U3B534_9VIBR|nr:hypothetical protein [Vibrio albus]PWI31882.1 hypothetical protein DI392_18550 [Vibrio albus]